MEEEQLQAKYMEYKMLDEKIKEMREQSQMLEQQIVEIGSTLQSVDEYANVKENTELLVPLNSGIFVKATIKKEEKVLVNVGASIVVDKTIDETKALIEKQKSEMQVVHAKITQNIQKLLARATALEKELNELVQE